MIRFLALWLALGLPVLGHELVLDVEMQRPEVLVRASYGPGEPAARVAVVASTGAAGAINGETDPSGEFAFTPPSEGEWQVRVDDGYGHVATRAVVVNWVAPAAELSRQSNLWARAGAGLILIFGLTALAVWGRRRAAQQP